MTPPAAPGTAGGEEAALRPPPPPPALVSGGLDGALTLWLLPPRSPASTTTPSGGGAVWGLAVSPDGDRLAAACDDGGVRLFELEGGGSAGAPPYLALTASLPRAPDRALCVAWHPGGRALVTGHADGVLRAWDVGRGGVGSGEARSSTRGRELFRADAGAGAPVWCVAVLPDGTIATGDGGGAVRLWDAEHGTPVASFRGAHGGDVLSLAAVPPPRRVGASAPAGPSLFSAGADGRVASFVCMHSTAAAVDGAAPTANGGWSEGPSRAPHGGRDARALALVPPPPPCAGGGRGAATPPALLASGGNDAHVVVHGVADFGRAHPARACRAPQAPTVCVAPSPPSHPPTPPALLTVQRRTADLYALGVPARRGDAASRASGWGWAEGAPVDVVAPPTARARVTLSGPGHASAAAVSAGGRWIALATAARTALFEVVVVGEGSGGSGDTTTRVLRTRLPPSVPPAAGLAFTPASDRLLIASPDGGLVVVDIGVAGPPTVAATLAPPPPPRARDGGGAPGAPPPPPPTSLDALSPPATAVVASPCGRWAAVHGPGGASVFDLAALTAVWRPPRPPTGGPLAAAAFDAAGALLLLTAGGGIAAFDVASRAPVAWAGDGGDGGARRGGAPARGAPPSLSPLPGAAVGLSACPSPGSRRVLVCTPAALCAADLGTPRTPPPAAPPAKRRRTARGGAVPAPAGANPRPLPLEHACLAAAYVGPGAALLVERAWSDAAVALPAPLLRARFGE